MPKKTSIQYPVLLLRNNVVFPHERATVMLEGADALRAMEAALRAQTEIVVTPRRDDGVVGPIGVRARILQSSYLSPKVVGAILEGVSRVHIKQRREKNHAPWVSVMPVESGQHVTQTSEALARSIMNQFRQLAQLDDEALPFIFNQLSGEHTSPEQVSDVAAGALRLEFTDKVRMLETLDVEERLTFLNQKVAHEVAVAEVEKKIQYEVQQKVGEEQRHFYLREHLKAIEKELGLSGGEEEFLQLEKQIKDAKLPAEAERRAHQELQRLRTMPPASAEAPYIRTYLTWLLEIPWTKRKKSRLNLARAKHKLDHEHFALEKAKNRIIEYLAVEKLTRGKHRGSIMCFVGPPGTGKTSVGKSIAEAMGRDFVRVSLGGVRDEAEIRGHRRTYVGAMPGRIIQALRSAGSNNPVFMLDEIDKLGADFRGDPAAALLEVLDPQQNAHFSDHYLELPFDLSNVIFIATANVLDPIPAPLRDRMEVIEFFGYTEEEKFQIAKTYLIPRVFASHGLSGGEVSITDAALRTIINRYTREAGVRGLERRIAEVSRKVARYIAEGRRKKILTITPHSVAKYLGPEEFESAVRETKDDVGVATGLAWMPSGGEIIFIETRLMPGTGQLTLTGQLGKVMQESAKAALSYVRSRSHELKFESNFFQRTDIHVHVPSGAIAKDGPSAGVALAVALASALTGRKIKSEVAVTGEISLTGKVLPVGGIKEKVLAAHRAGITTVVLPQKNKAQLFEISQTVRDEITIVLADHMDEVLPVVLAAAGPSLQSAPVHISARVPHPISA